MKITAAVRVSAIFAIACAVVPAVRADDDSPLIFCQWADAVAAHLPGTADAAVQAVWTLTPTAREAIVARLPGFLFLLENPAAPLMSRVKVETPVDATAVRISAKLTPTTFLERAAMLHADAVIFDRRTPGAPAAPALRLPRLATNASPGPTSPMFVTSDGEVVGVVVSNWNWPFARGLLDRIAPIPAGDTFISIWYHATTAYMLRRGEFGEARPHLEHASQVLPDDALVAFDHGCLNESFGTNAFQQLVTGDRTAFVFANGRPSNGSGSYASTRPNIPSANDANSQATAFFEHAIVANPGLVEAHVRLAHELEIAGDYAAAEAHIRQALTMSPPDDVAFYAHLFGARAAGALGHDDEAEAHIRAALDLFPSAGSAIVASSHVAFQRADPGTALERLGQLAQSSTTVSDAIDPWRAYSFGAGRAAELPLTELWHRVPKLIGQ